MIPEHITDELARYVEHRIPPGGFILAVLENDLRKAVEHADLDTQMRFTDIVKHVYCKLPIRCRGSRQSVVNWLGGRGPQAATNLPGGSATDDRFG